jgi:DNA polymerase-3 subunit delta'
VASEPFTATSVPPVLARLAGQPRAVQVLSASISRPLHAYLLVGPSGAGKREAAVAFAAALLCPNGGCGACGSCAAVRHGTHPDLVTVERTGASILVDDVREVSQLSHRTPTVGDREVIILNDFHLAALAAPALLKTIEEPPESTTFVVVADGRPAALATIASRCVVVEFTALVEEEIVAFLLANGVDEVLAHAAASGAQGRIDRAQLLVRDPDFVARQQLWRRVPEELDGTGATVSKLVVELLAGGEALVAIVKARQGEELEALVAEAERNGGRLIGRAAIEQRHNREQRRVKNDELRSGLATLAEAYRSRLAFGGRAGRHIGTATTAISAIDAMASSLNRNPIESLQLARLLLTIDGAATS